MNLYLWGLPLWGIYLRGDGLKDAKDTGYIHYKEREELVKRINYYSVIPIVSPAAHKSNSVISQTISQPITICNLLRAQLRVL